MRKGLTWGHSSFSSYVVEKNAKHRPAPEALGSTSGPSACRASVQTAGVLSCLPDQHRSLTAAPGLACALRTVHLAAATEVSPGQTSLEEESI